MAIEKVSPTTLPGVVAAADYTAAQHRFVSLDAAGKAALTGDGALMSAVMTNNPDADQAVTGLGPGSVAKVQSSGAITAGDAVASAANGEAKAAASGNYIAGQAMNDAAAGELVSVYLTFPGRLA